MAEKNQTEAEFFNIVATGRRGVEDMLKKMRPEMDLLAAPNVKPEMDAWLTRALVDITSRDELKELIATRSGLLSVYNAMARALALGLQIGGQVPHAYIVPKGGKAVLVPTAEGMEFATVYGPGAVLKWAPDLIEVHEKDTVVIDEKGGEYTRDFPDKNPFADRGKLIGFFAQLEYLDGRIRIPHIAIADVEHIEKSYGNTNTPGYQKSPMQMHEKTAKKQLLKAAFREASGVASKREVEIDLGPEFDARPVRNVTERVADRLDRAAEALDPTKAQPPAPEPAPEAAPAAAEAAGAAPKTGSGKDPLDLF